MRQNRCLDTSYLHGIARIAPGSLGFQGSTQIVLHPPRLKVKCLCTARSQKALVDVGIDNSKAYAMVQTFPLREDIVDLKKVRTGYYIPNGCASVFLLNCKKDNRY